MLHRYDNATWPLASDVDIVSRTAIQLNNTLLYYFIKDHLIPLKEAWVSGARSWSTAMRQALANDLVRPQLLAVTDNVNQSKG